MTIVPTSYPRSEIRREVIQAIREVLDCPVYDSYTRDFRKGLNRFVSVFTPSEFFESLDGTGGEARPGVPVKRQIMIEVAVCVQEAGDGMEAADEADKISRLIEVKFNKEFSALRPVQTSINFESGDLISCLIMMTYQVEYIDEMKTLITA